MEDDLKISKVEYLCNHWLDLPEILNLNSGDQSNIKNVWNKEDFRSKVTVNGRRPPMEVNICRWPQNIKSWIYQQPMIESSWNLNLSTGDQTKIKITWNKEDFRWKVTANGRRPPMEDNICRWISHQPLIGSSSNLSRQPLIRSSSNYKLNLRGPILNHFWSERWRALSRNSRLLFSRKELL